MLASSSLTQENISVLEKSNNLDSLPLDNYLVPLETLTEEVKEHLLANPRLSGVMITQAHQVIGAITRRTLFEKLSKEFSHGIYATKPISVLLNSLRGKEEILKVSATTLITDAVKLSFSRPIKSAYDPIMVIKNGQEQGMLDFSKLILAQSEMFSALNEQLMQQDQDLRNYAEQVEEQRQNVQQYAVRLELQQQELQQHNTLLERQKTQLQHQTEELFQKSEEISNLNKRFEEVGILVSREGKKTFQELGDSVQSVLEFTQKINGVSSDFQEKLTMIEQGNDLINKVSKRVENISYQASVLGGSLPLDHQNKLAFNMMIEEIKKLSVQILEVNTAINKISKEIRPQIRMLVKIAQENQEVVTTLAQNSQNTEVALASLSQLLE
ncbi:MAG: hypothetical protein VKL42_19625 [Snowella sp.]|nr:hypothetical protein [Snowella sp.]